jgi:hypothetical protein
MTSKEFIHYCLSVEELELFNFIHSTTDRIRKHTAIGFFIHRFGYEPECIQLHLF